MHTESAASGRHDRRNRTACLRRDAEQRRDLRNLFQQLAVHHHVFTGADDELWNKILLFLLFVVAVKFQNTRLAQAVRHFLRLLGRHTVALGQLLHIELVDALFLEREHELHFVLVHDLVKTPHFGVVVDDVLQLFLVAPVGDHQAELAQKLALLRILDDIRIREIVILVEHVVFERFVVHRPHSSLFLCGKLQFYYTRFFCKPRWCIVADLR